MGFILDKITLESFVIRANKVTNDQQPSWGKMNAGQMLQHLNKSIEFIFTDEKVKRMFAGRIIGKIILKKVLKSNDSLAKNSPTAPSFVASDSVEFEKEKSLFLERLKQLESIKEENLDGKIHPFFGEMTGNQWNILLFKHINHHLNQFNV